MDKKIANKMLNSHIIYCHKNKYNNKTYIGITGQNAQARWKNGNGYSTQAYFYKAIKKYGWDGFEHIIIKEGLPEACAKTLEKILIYKYKTNTPENGYNITSGGEGTYGYTFSNESRAKMSNSKKGKTPWNKGKKGIYTLETLVKIGNASKGRITRVKPILRFDMNGNFIARYNSMKEAVKSVNGERSGLYLALKENRPYKNNKFIYDGTT